MIISKTTQNWWRWGLFNLAVVALYGMTMRYKIAFDFPFFNQKNLLHAHSHFAFAGWISHILYSGIAFIAASHLKPERIKRYNWIIVFNLLVSFGMLFAFTVQGYKTISIVFSTLSIVVAICFTLVFTADWNALHASRSRPWIATGLGLNIISAAGPLYLAYTLATKTVTPNGYLGSIYYYLHFQYSGWFFFGGMALIMAVLPQDFPSLKRYFNVFSFTAIPTFFLSVLWLKLPTWLYIITVIATMAQLIAWLLLVSKCIPYFKNRKLERSVSWISWFFYAAAIAMSLKFILQAVSVIPSLSQLVFGLRPIVIAYLHLVLLGVYSLFIIGYSFYNNLIKLSKATKIIAFTFMLGVILNEIFLAVQGFAGFFYIPIPHVNELLFVAGVILFSSALFLFLFQFKRVKS
jgi:hypothetical protein